MPNISNLRKTIGRYLGATLTPEIAVEIELSANAETDASIEPNQFDVLWSGGFSFQAERLCDILDEMHLLHVMHWQETEKHRHGLPLNPDYLSMLADEHAGRMVQFTVRRDGALVGGLRMYVAVSRHSQTLKAIEDTLYIAPTARGGMTAITLMRYAESALLRLGVREIEADSKLVNKADVLMRRMKYTPVAIKFNKVFGENINVQ